MKEKAKQLMVKRTEVLRKAFHPEFSHLKPAGMEALLKQLFKYEMRFLYDDHRWSKDCLNCGGEVWRVDNLAPYCMSCGMDRGHHDKLMRLLVIEHYGKDNWSGYPF